MSACQKSTSQCNTRLRYWHLHALMTPYKPFNFASVPTVVVTSVKLNNSTTDSPVALIFLVKLEFGNVDFEFSSELWLCVCFIRTSMKKLWHVTLSA